MKQKQHGHRYVIGIDPGHNGGFVALKDGKVVSKLVMPKVGKDIDFDKLGRFFRFYKKRGAVVYLEKVMGRGGAWGATQNFNFGQCYGAIMGVTAVLKLRYILVSPATWQKVSFKGIPVVYKTGKKKKTKDTKAMALMASKRLFPSANFAPTERSKKPHDGLVDAVLIAYYGDLEQRGLNG
jgi:hypothetical protein